MRKAVLTLLLPMCLWSAAPCADPRGALEQAISAYTEAQAASRREDRVAGFQQAQQLFELVRAQGVHSADLYTNLGNAALQAERLGPAILAYRRALVLDPNHAQARQNLLHARSLLPAWVPRPEQEGALESFFFWRHTLSPTEQASIAAACFLLAALLFAVAIRWQATLARTLAIMPLLVWVGLLISLAIEAQSDGFAHAVITAEETLARAADSPNAPVRFAEPLPGGTEVEIRESRDHWAHIVFANRRDAWVPRGALEPVEEGGLASRSPAPAE
jgi:tetratricopeptide (TPR) repeat protein